MTFPNEEQRQEAAKLIADHNANNFYSFNQRLDLLMMAGHYAAGLVNIQDPFQVGDVLCALDNARIPFEFRPEVSAKLARISASTRSVFGKRTPSVDDNVRELILRIMEEGVDDETRTGIRSRAVNSVMHTYDISRGQLPAVSSKYTWIEGVKVELVWMISGATNIRFLKEHKVNIWDSWVKPDTVVCRDLSLEERISWAKKAGLTPTFDWNNEPNRHTVDYLNENQVPHQEMIDGELPKIYQHQWRQWNDTRVVCREETDAYEAKGYDFRGMLLTPDDLSSGACNGSVGVVSRKIDQLQRVIDQLRNNPDDRGIILSAWNVGELEDMALRPCHTLCQFFSKPMSVRERLAWLAAYKPAGFEGLSEAALDLANAHDDRRHETQLKHYPETLAFLDDAGVPTRKLSSLLYQRSQDVPLGHPFNIVQYAMLTHMIAQCVGMATDTFTWVGGDCHIYEDQWPAVLQWLEQPAHPESTPTINLNPAVGNLFDFKVSDIEVVGYHHSGRVKFPQAAV